MLKSTKRKVIPTYYEEPRQLEPVVIRSESAAKVYDFTQEGVV